jgi:GTP-binding protein Era
MGIVNGDDFQIVYSDTPGIVKDPSYKMHEYMNQYIESALVDADVILLMHETGQFFEENDVLERIIKANIPVIVIINKIDLSDQESVVKEMQHWSSRLPGAEVIPISAIKNFNIAKVFDEILTLIPESPPFFPKDELSDRSVRFFVSEIIREKVFTNYKKEVPYAVEVAVDEYKEEPKLVRISATIFVDRESQKAIILGHQGKSIKKVGTEARKDIEEFIQNKVFLEITVKVNKDWREKENMLKRFGYDH